MKNKKLFAILTLVCFMFTLMPVAAFASDTGNVYLTGQQITETGKYVLKDGTWTTTESAVSYVDVDFATKIITLNGVEISLTADDEEDCISQTAEGMTQTLAAGIYVADASEWTVKLVGENSIAVENSYQVSQTEIATKMHVVAGIFCPNLKMVSESDNPLGNLKITIKDNTNPRGLKTCAGVLSNKLELNNCELDVDMLIGDDNGTVFGGIVGTGSLSIDDACVDVLNEGTYGSSIQSQGEMNITGEKTKIEIDNGNSIVSGISAETLNISSGEIVVEGNKAIFGTNTSITGGIINVTAGKTGIGGVNVTIGSAEVSVKASGDAEEDYSAIEIINNANKGNATITTGNYEGTISVDKNATVNIGGNADAKNITGKESANIFVTGGSVGSITTGIDSSVTVSGEETTITGDITMAGTSGEDKTAMLTISGGNIGGKIDAGEGTTANVSGGTFSQPVNPEYLADGLNVQVKTEDGYTYFEDVEDAKEAAKDDASAEIGIVTKGEGEGSESITTPLTYTVTFNTNGGSAVTPQSIEWNKTATEPTAPIKDGFTFIDWFTSEDDGATLSATAYDFDTPVEKDITLYAKWEENKAPSYTGGYYTPSTSTDAEVTSPNEDVTLTAKAISTSTLNDAKEAVADDENVTVIGGKDSAVQISAKEDGKALDSFVQPVTVTVPVSKSALKDVDNVNNLTLALVTEDANGNTVLTYVGGNYDAQEGTFTAYTNQPGNYVLVEKQDIVKIDMFIGSNTSIINGETVANDVAAYIANNRTMVPVAFIMDQLGCKVDWFGDERKVVITLPDGRQLSMIIDQEIPGFGAVPVIKDDRTMVPIAYIADAMGAHVLWVGDEYRVVIVK